MMRNVLVVVTVVMCDAVTLGGEIRIPARELEYRSTSGRYVADVTPAKEGQKPSLAVFEVQGRERVPLWQCDLGNEEAPTEAAISDDGQYVVTCNEWFKVASGDFVLAFYRHGGLVKHYPLAQVLHPLQGVSSSQVSDLITRSSTSSPWDQDSIKLFDAQADRHCFGIWLASFDRWLVWDARNGEPMALYPDEIEGWNDKARSWAIRQIRRRPSDEASCTFLATRKNPDDRILLEALLSNPHFGASGRFVGSASSPASHGKRVLHLNRHYCYSTERLLGDQSLAKWDARGGPKNLSAFRRLHYLGIVEGAVTLPQVDGLNKARLWIYLVPAEVPRDQWAENLPVHRMTVTLALPGSDKEETRAFPFGISTIKPGRYWVKAVLDKADVMGGQSWAKDRRSAYEPRSGDYENVDSPIVTVVAGKTENVSVDCTHKVTDGAD
jgi:hypothetical protein